MNLRTAIEAVMGTIGRPFSLHRRSGDGQLPLRGCFRIASIAGPKAAAGLEAALIGSALMVNIGRIARYRARPQELQAGQGTRAGAGRACLCFLSWSDQVTFRVFAYPAGSPARSDAKVFSLAPEHLLRTTRSVAVASDAMRAG